MKRILICTALLIYSGLCSAAVYKWVDAHGKTQYGDRPPDGVVAELIPMLVSHPSSSSSVSSAAAPQRTATGASNIPTPATNSTEKKAVQNDVEAVRAKQCTDAQERYKRDIESRRMFKSGADGARVYLSGEEIDAERLAAKQAVDNFCNSPN